MSDLNNIVNKILGNGKGILAADESTGTMTKRLDGVGVPSTPENRLLFRETLFCSSEMKNCIGGVILYDETIKQTSSKKNKILAHRPRRPLGAACRRSTSARSGPLAATSPRTYQNTIKKNSKNKYKSENLQSWNTLLFYLLLRVQKQTTRYA